MGIYMQYKIDEYKSMTSERLNELFEKIKSIKIGFIGDLCIDIYWLADMRKSELSRETPHFPLPVVEERFQLGAGGNVVANLASLRPAEIIAAGVIGDDWRGGIVQKCLAELGISTDKIIIRKNKTTNAYCKPLRKGISEVVYEDPRIDFTGEPLTEDEENILSEKIKQMIKEVNCICVSDQFLDGCVTEKIRNVINEAALRGVTFIIDSRDKIAKYKNCILKPNEVESARAASALCGLSYDHFALRDIEGFAEAAQVIKEHLGCDLSMTLGSRGNMQFYENKITHISSNKIEGAIDICGAGDTFLSAYTCAVAAGANHEEAGQLASLASEVTIKKLGKTGTASSEEILSIYK